MINAIIGKKIDQTHRFLEDGKRIPVTEVSVMDNPVITIKTKDKNGYNAVQIGFGTKKHSNKSLLGNVKAASLEAAPLFLREVRVGEEDVLNIKPGDLIKVLDVLKPGDIIDVSGVSKGKGFAGGVKRYHFKGGPRTHGQSDRERAPGSIGQSTTPGRVYKGKRMAGKMGAKNVTVKNLQIVDVLENKVLIKGLIPGFKNSLVIIKKTGTLAKFTPLYKEEVKEESENIKAEVKEKKDAGK
ncbi:MAG: 50S ribosomal protein L3 [Patescibacteria group bacterium]|nr:50S ribosomal protein L3 [Patescibacteria group bacterium]